MKKKLTKPVKVWLCVSVPVFTLALIISVVGVCVPFLKGTMDSVFGSGTQSTVGDSSKYVYYEKDYATKAEVLAAANAFNEEICEEGFVLLKNEDEALPLKKTAKITVFGRNSVDLVLGGSGSNAGSSHSGEEATLYSSLTAAGLSYNPVVKSFYENDSTRRAATPGMGSILTGLPIAETPIERYTSDVRDSYKDYSDAALVVLSRVGGEGYDLPRTMFWNGSNYTTWTGTEVIPGAKSKTSHYLELDLNEEAMIKEACDNFDKVIVVINSSSTMELGFLVDSANPVYSDKIKSAVWIGGPGNSGVNALGRILCGEVNPSGRTVDTWAKDFTLDPTWANFGNNMQKGGNTYLRDGKEVKAYFVRYQEGIYTGYRYYETRGYEEEQAGNSAWYGSNVVFPFGYGLSYTEFEWDVTAVTPEGNISGSTEISVKVKVTNVGSVAGKDVVQLYYTSPYVNGGIEKSRVTLGAFGKTKLLAAGESEELTLTLKARDMASYDYNDANKNGFYGYELEAGEYLIGVCSDSHTAVKTLRYTVSEACKYETDDRTGTTIKNLFEDADDKLGKRMSRSDFAGTFPTLVTAEERIVDKAFTDSLTYKLNDKESDPWYSTETPAQSATKLSATQTKVKLYDLIGKDYDDALWDDLLKQLTVAEMKELISKGNYRTIALENLVKPLTIDADGPMGFSVFMGDPSVYDTCFYAAEVVLASTWNEELAYDMGVMIGNEGLVGYEKGDKRTYSGWYAPAMNVHRSQFGGRNFEYYSEDGFISGVMATGVVKGAKSKGVYTYSKHFALNEQETNRDTTGLITWADEQCMREVYLKPFEAVVKEGGATAMMSSFNRIGKVWAGGNYNLLTSLLREEWGFKGMVITDYNLTPYMNVDQMIRAGGDLNLSPSKDLSADESATSVTAIRRAAHNILYTVANSNAMNGLGEGVSISYGKAAWEMMVIVVDIVLGVGFALWGVFVVAHYGAYEKTEEKA